MQQLAILVCGFICGAFQYTGAESSQLQFAVERNADVVGTLTISKQKEDSRVTYTLSSEVSVDFILTIKISEKITDVFQNEELSASSHQRYINGTRKAHHVVTKPGDVYEITNHNDRKRTLSATIQASVVSVYFNEPSDSQWVYSQNFQKMIWMEKTGQHSFRIALPNGNVSYYTYEGGIVKTVVTDTQVGILRFVNQNIHSEK